MIKRVVSAVSVILAVAALTACDAGWEALGDVSNIGTASGSTSSAPLTSEPTSSTDTLSSTATTYDESSRFTESVVSQSAPPESSDWKLILVNPTHPVDSITRDNLVELTVLQKSNGNGKYFDRRAASYIYEMFEAAEQDGVQLLSRSTFRTLALQQSYYDSSYNSYLNQGLSPDEAKRRTLEYTAYPGTSEHHTGLAIDITTKQWEAQGRGLTDSFAQSDGGKWLNENAHKYGFILRYPKEKEEITKIKYEPWHFRFVGVEAATEIHERGICLEEYLGILD